MRDTITVGISDMKVVRSPGVLVTYALGSCVGICLYDELLKIAALGHIMLPTYPPDSSLDNQHRYADTCIPLMLREMERLGANRARIRAKICGGAKMFQVEGDLSFGSIGSRNVEAVKKALGEFRIPLHAEDTGLNYGRTVFFDAENGTMTVKSFSNGMKIL